MRIVAAVAILTSAFAPLAAQMPWTANLPQQGFALDILRPKVQGGGTTLTSFAAYASGRFPVGGMSIRFELPYARLAVTGGGGSSSTIGNPYIGVETGGAKGLGFEAGLRVPLASETEFASEFGPLSDFTRFEAFAPNNLTVVTRAHWHFQDVSGFTFDAGGGPSVLIPTKGGGDPEMILHHHMSAGYTGSDVWAAIAFGGWTIITEDVGGVGERTINEVGASFGIARGQVRPALHVIAPLDDGYNSQVGIVIGLGVSVTMK
jgi:hypothetical protein